MGSVSMHKSSLEGVYDLIAAAEPLPLVFDSPHSGTISPPDFNHACTDEDLEKAEDKFVDDLFSSAPDHGGCLLSALFPRAYLDVNRAHDDVDPELLSELWPYGDMPINPTKPLLCGHWPHPSPRLNRASLSMTVT